MIFFICPIAGKERKAIFAKPFQKRISEGLFLKSAVNFNKKIEFGAVVQSVRISACHAEGRGFESRPHRPHKIYNTDNWCGSSVG